MPRRSAFPSRMEFCQWLQSDRLVSITTARSYASCIGTVLRLIPEEEVLSEKSITEIFKKLETRSGYNNYCTAWNAFVEWALVKKGAKVPSPRRSLDSAAEVVALPEEALALADLIVKSGISLPVLQLLKKNMLRDITGDSAWAARVSVPSYLLFNPVSLVDGILLPMGVVKRWLDLWPSSTGEEGLLFPRWDGASEPYPTKTLRRALRDYRNTKKEERLLSPVLVSDGSALGGLIPKAEEATEGNGEGQSALPAAYREAEEEEDAPDIPGLADSMAFVPQEEKGQEENLKMVDVANKELLSILGGGK